MRRLPVETREVRRINAGSLDFMTMNKYLIKPLQKVKALQDDIKKAVGLLGKRGKVLAPAIAPTAQKLFGLTNSLITTMQEYSPGRAASAKKLLARGKFLSLDVEMQHVIQMSESWMQEVKNISSLVTVGRQFMPPDRYERIRSDLAELLDNLKTFNWALKQSA